MESGGACERQPSGVVREFEAPEYRSGQELSQRAFSNSHASPQRSQSDSEERTGVAPTADSDHENPKRVVFLTAGAAGMYCGSCMHDNALARELRTQGVDCLLQPVYTPIRTDAMSGCGQKVPQARKKPGWRTNRAWKSWERMPERHEQICVAAHFCASAKGT